MKDILSAPWLTELVRTCTNMYAHGWDERNGGNISRAAAELGIKRQGLQYKLREREKK